MARDFRENLVAPSAAIIEALKVIDRYGVGIALVHDNGRLVGTVTDGDVRRGMLAGLNIVSAPVAKIMNTRPVTAPPGISDAEAAGRMRAHAVMQLPLVDGHGMIAGLKVLKDIQPAGAAGNPVVIMAGGRGTRLKELTWERPKPMVAVGGKPMLETIVERFVEQGFTDIAIAVNYMREMIEDYFGGGEKWGARISFLRETDALGTAGALALLPRTPERPVIVINGDILTRVDFRQLARFHDEQDAPATMAVRAYQLNVPYGVVVADGLSLKAIEEKPTKNFIVNAGIYVIGPGALGLIPKGCAFDMPQLFTALLDRAATGQGRRPALFMLHEYITDVDAIRPLLKAEQEFMGHMYSGD